MTLLRQLTSPLKEMGCCPSSASDDDGSLGTPLVPADFEQQLAAADARAAALAEQLTASRAELAQKNAEVDQNSARVRELIEQLEQQHAAALEEERQALYEAEAELCVLEEKFETEETFIDFFASGETKDIVDLDICLMDHTVNCFA